MTSTQNTFHAKPVPDDLVHAMHAALHRQPWARDIEILSAQNNPYASSWTTGLISCRSANATVRIFYKRSLGTSVQVQQHTGGLVYEHEVYKNILNRSRLSQPRSYGSATGEEGDHWLFLESLEQCDRWSLTTDPDAVALKIARWLGVFHAEQELTANRIAETAWLRQHDYDYFTHWINQTVAFARPIAAEVSWLENLSEAAKSTIPYFLTRPRTVIHGEIFPHNVLVDKDDVLPVDWEGASIGVGEEDLASMTDNWGTEVVEACEREYAASRWPGNVPSDFCHSLTTAKLFHHFRWIGDNADRAITTSRWRFDLLLKTGVQLNLI